MRAAGPRFSGALLVAAVLMSAGCGAAQGPSRSSASPTSSDPDVQAVRADLQKLVESMGSRHPDLFRDMTKVEWQAAVDRLDALIPELVPDEPERLYVEFLRLVALPGVVGGRNGHMSAGPTTPRPVLGIITYTFADGVFITRAMPPQQELIGGRITAVEGRPIEEVRELLDPLIRRDNQWTPEIWLGDHLRQPEILVGLGIVDAVGPVEVAVQAPNGEARRVQIPLLEDDQALLPSQPPLAWLPMDFALLHYLPPRPEALWTSRMGEAMWWTTLDDGRTLYVQQSLFEPPPPSLLAGILEAARAPAVERVILDLRHNMGGDDDGGTLRTFRDAAIDRPGRLFVITSTNVFSAAPPFVSELDRTTNAVIVGEPTGGSPWAFGGGSSVTLDRLPIALTVDVPSGRGGPDDERLTIDPDILVPLLGTDYFGGRDAALEAILAYEP